VSADDFERLGQNVQVGHSEGEPPKLWEPHLVDVQLGHSAANGNGRHSENGGQDLQVVDPDAGPPPNGNGNGYPNVNGRGHHDPAAAAAAMVATQLGPACVLCPAPLAPGDRLCCPAHRADLEAAP
jgi:hypothetical protein